MKRYISSHKITSMVVIVMMFLMCFFAGRVTADQPYMRAALEALQQAQTQLQLAVPDKGGHRVRALELVNQAINEVQLGIDFAEGD